MSDIPFSPDDGDKSCPVTPQECHEILMDAPIGMFKSTPGGRLLLANHAVASMYGYDSPEEMTTSVTDIATQLYVDPADRLRLFQRLEHADSVKDVESLQIRRDGSTFWMSESVHAVRDQEGGISHIRGFVTDISARKQTEEALRESEARFRTLVDTLGEGIILQEASGRIVHWNKTAEDILDFRVGMEEELTCVNRDWKTIREDGTPFPGQEHPSMHTLRTGESCYGVIMGIKRDNQSTIWIKINTRPLFKNNDPTPHSVVVSFSDITELKKTKDQLCTSEGLLRGLFDNMTSGAAIYEVLGDGSKGADYIIKDFNRTSLTLEGKSKQNVIGKSLHELRPNIDAYGLIPYFQKVWHTGEPAIFPSKLYMETRYRRWYENRVFKLPSGEIVAIYDDVTERHENEEKIRREAAVNFALADIAKALTQPGSTLAAIAGVVYMQALRLTNSPFGYVSSIDPLTGDNVGHTLSSMMDKSLCQMKDKRIAFPRGKNGYSGLFGHSLNTLKSFFTNDPAAHPFSKGLPEGHVPLKRFLSVPAVYEGELYGQIALANAERDYTQEDLALVDSLAHLFAMAIFRMRMEENLITARDAAGAANLTKSEFLANMSHEIRTPLNGILGMMQLLESTSLDKDQKQYVHLAMTSANRLTGLLSDILDLSRVEAGRMELFEAPFSLEELRDSISGLFTYTARNKGVALDCTVDSSFESKVSGDDSRVRQVLFNLVGNALKFTDKGTVIVEIVPLTPRWEGDVRVLFSVADTGIGIPEDRLRDIFEPFRQVDGSYTRKYQGAGLGLAIVRRLVDLMHGDIFIESEPNLGTTVLVVLPFKPVENITIGGPLTDNDAPARQGLRILLAEDDPSNQLPMQQLLENEGHTVTLAENGQQVLDLLQTREFDCILMDVQMPLMDGVRVTKMIRRLENNAGMPEFRNAGIDQTGKNAEMPECWNAGIEQTGKDAGIPASPHPGISASRHPRIPIIALTAYAMSGDREKFLAAGMDDYLAKPVRMEDLKKALDQIFRRK